MIFSGSRLPTVRQAVVDNLPSTVTGDVDVSIGGGPFLVQYLAGTFSEVTVTSKNMQVNGQPIQVSVTANDVSTDSTKPIPRASATLTLDQAAVNSFLSIPGSDEIVLADGTVGYSGQVQVFGLTLGYDATATAAGVGRKSINAAMFLTLLPDCSNFRDRTPPGRTPSGGRQDGGPLSRGRRQAGEGLSDPAPAASD